MIEYKLAEEKDLRGIIDLQRKNLPINLSENEIKNEGFLTLIHTLELLSKMNKPFPHVIAEDKGIIIAYALVMMPIMESSIPDLSELMYHLNNHNLNGKMITESKYFIMGQICVDKDYRKQGIFKKLYLKMVDEMKEHFDYIITEVAISNQRSLQAHLAAGFEIIIRRQSANGKEWAVVKLDL